MKFTLKDYQDEAVKEVLDRLKKARKRWHEDQRQERFFAYGHHGCGQDRNGRGGF